MWQRHWDPRLNPALRPEEWERIRLRNRILFYLLAAVLASGLIAVAVYFYFPFDRTKGLTPVAIAQSAGDALLSSAGYHFTVDLRGKSTDDLFPVVNVQGEYQKAPQLLHLGGEVTTGDAKVAVEYYLDGSTLYIRHPTDKTWMLLQDAELDELTAFYPDNLAAPFISGVESAEIVDRDRLPGGNAVALRLNLDPSVMLPHSPTFRDDKTEYTLWVYTRDLKPARFIMTVQSAPQAGAEQERHVTHFTYELEWTFPHRQAAVGVPAAVKGAARALENEGDGPPRPDELPGLEGDDHGPGDDHGAGDAPPAGNP